MAPAQFRILDFFSAFVPFLSRIKTRIGGQIALCGGVNNMLVIEKGMEDEVPAAVADAIEKLSPNSGFILAPGDSPDYMGNAEATTKRNIYKMIEVWKTLRRPPPPLRRGLPPRGSRFPARRGAEKCRDFRKKRLRPGARRGIIRLL